MESVRFPWDITPVPVAAPAGEDAPTRQTPRGRRPRSALPSAAAPGWLYHHLTVSGPADAVATFAAAARGSGVIPWRLDFADIEETVFTLAVAQPASRRSLTVEGCRILARQYRDKVEAHQARAAALVGQSLACPFDLHRLLPLPDAILQLGPAHPDALAWLAREWGVSDRLRQVAVRENATAGRRLPRGHTVIGYGFFTAGDTPYAAMAQLATRWPALRLAVRPRPAD
jgi:hypothetical protein